MPFVRTVLATNTRTTTTDTLATALVIPAGPGILEVVLGSENGAGDIVWDSADLSGVNLVAPGGNYVGHAIEGGADALVEMRYQLASAAGSKTLNTSVSGAARYGVIASWLTGVKLQAPEAVAAPASVTADGSTLFVQVMTLTDNAAVASAAAEATGLTGSATTGSTKQILDVAGNMSLNLSELQRASPGLQSMAWSFAGGNFSRATEIAWAWAVLQSLPIPAPIAPFRHLLVR